MFYWEDSALTDGLKIGNRNWIWKQLTFPNLPVNGSNLFTLVTLLAMVLNLHSLGESRRLGWHSLHYLYYKLVSCNTEKNLVKPNHYYSSFIYFKLISFPGIAGKFRLLVKGNMWGQSVEGLVSGSFLRIDWNYGTDSFEINLLGVKRPLWHLGDTLPTSRYMN